MKTIFATTDREGINAVKWTLRMAGASKRFASWAVETACGFMEVETPNGNTIVVVWVA